jgi:SAM-dependent methyltransferase
LLYRFRFAKVGLARHLASNGFRVLGIDISHGQLKQAAHHRIELPAQAAELVDFRLEDAATFRRPNCFALAVACFSTVFELGGPEARVAVYRRCFENLRPGGLLAIDNSYYGTGENAD